MSEGFGAEAPQPTDDGLAAMAEIGGDFAVPTRGEGEANEDEERAPSSRRRRGRRGRRGGGDRERFGAPAPAGDTTPVDSEAEPNLFDNPPREPRAAALETAPLATAAEAALPASGPEAAPTAVASHTEPLAATAAPANESALAGEPAAKAEEPAVDPEPTPAAEDPSRPRRSGWWQRARATLSGE